MLKIKTEICPVLFPDVRPSWFAVKRSSLFGKYAASVGLMILLFAPAAFSGEVRLPSVLSDHMVLQCGAVVPVWGWVEPSGSQVEVRFKGQIVSTVADAAGKWRVDLAPMAADATPAMMTVVGGGQTITVEDILVGEVWLCSGQSNMEWPVKRFANAEQEIATANWPLIRHIKAPKILQSLPQENTASSWTVCSPQTVAEYTATGYYFARRLHQELRVPIGILNCSWGGTKIEPWIPIEGYAALPEFDVLYHKIAAKRPGSEVYQLSAGAYLQAMTRWLEKGREQFLEEAALSEPPVSPDAVKPYTRLDDPTVLYNGMIAPFVPFAIRGSIWYQGESDHGDGMRYLTKTRALVKGWRTVWNNPNLPYYFVQIAPYSYGVEDPFILPEFWEAQSAIAGKIPHTGMVVISDIGDLTTIHPANKQGVGLRLANMALKRDYGRKELFDCGPRFREVKFVGDKAILTFDYTGSGLASRDGHPLTGFEMTDSSAVWRPASVRTIAADTMELSAQGVAAPVAVRFAWHKLAEWNLVNSAGLPAEPFRAGNIPASSNLVARWTFTEGNCADEITGLKGQYYNNPANICVAEDALKLNNREVADRNGALFLVPDSPRLTGHEGKMNGYTSLVLEVDVQPETLGDLMQILRKTDGDLGYQLYVQGDGSVGFYIKTTNNVFTIVSKNRISADGVWSHIEAVWDNNLSGYNSYLAVDGVVTWGSQDIGSLANTSAPLAIGGIYRAEKNIGQRFSGSIDNVAISVNRPELIRRKLYPESSSRN